MNNMKFPDELKGKAVDLVINGGLSVSKVAKQLRVSSSSLYKWIKYIDSGLDESLLRELERREILLANLETKLRNIRNAKDGYACMNVINDIRKRSLYQYIDTERSKYSVTTLCRVLGVSRAGYYKWKKSPTCNRERENRHLLQLIRQSYEASNRLYGSPRVWKDLRDMGIMVNKKRVARLMRENSMKAVSKVKVENL